ncbi:MAG: hypothetical protein IK023_01780 [Bacteroidaceae bacterium]|nr:hypothetical protein [Bacteroidaceae bacterium]
MIYRFLLRNTKTGETAYIEAPAHWPLESLSPKIKVAMHLPYTDNEFHRFLLNGTVYVTKRMEDVLTEWMYEQDGPPYYDENYRCSEYLPLRRAFTTLGSAVNYIQNYLFCYNKIHVTLVERI